MMFLMFISFYTSRIVLQNLGVTDFGISNVVGGLASMFVFFRSSLANVTQRYLNIELGKGDVEGARKVFCLHQSIYIMITILVVIIAETIGLWFVYNKLVIPAERLSAALWVYHITVISFAVTILSVVYNSVLIARENMKVYSYVGVIEGLVKLANAYILSKVIWDKLITYQLLMLILSIGIFVFYALYCKRKYKEATYTYYWNKEECLRAFNMVGWNTIGTIVWTINDQGVNILLNIFFGPAINAARGISFQVSQAISNFGTNFMVSANPQIVKSYANKDYDYLYSLFFAASKYSVFLLWIFCLPVILCIDTILNVWLVNVPEYANIFTIWILIYSLVNMLNNPVWTLALAVGKLKKYILIGSGVFLLVFPISYIFLINGAPPTSVFIILVLIRVIYIFVVIKIIREYLAFSIKGYLSNVVSRILCVITISSIFGYVSKIFIPQTLSGTIIVAIISFISVIFAIWFVGINDKEKRRITSIIKSKLLRK